MASSENFTASLWRALLWPFSFLNIALEYKSLFGVLFSEDQGKEEVTYNLFQGMS